MKLKCRTLIIVGENSPFHCESVHMSTVMSRRYQALIEVNLSISFINHFFKVTWFSEYTWDFYPLAFLCNKELSIPGSREWSNCLSDISANCAQVQACGSLVTEEQPESMIVPIELFLMFYSFYKRPFSNSSPTSPLSPPCVPPELLSSEGLGLKLKPIKTRVAVQAWGRACLQIILSNLWVILCRRSLLFHDT